MKEKDQLLPPASAFSRAGNVHAAYVQSWLLFSERRNLYDTILL